MEIEKIEINLSFKPYKEISKKLVISLLDYLLHARSQIPFHFELFKRFVEDKSSPESCEDGNPKIDWKTAKQLKLAHETYEKICAIKRVIATEFAGGVPMMILFGNTIHTVKESYQIFIPETDETLPLPFDNDTNVINMTLLRILQTEGLKPSNRILPQTNVFILFGRQEPVEDHPELIWLKNFNLSKSCKKHIIHFRDPSDFQVLEDDFDDLQLSETTEINNETDCQQYYWLQSKTYIKGFKDVLVNNKSIWN